MQPTTRRSFLASAAFAGASLPFAPASNAKPAPADTFQFEVQRSDDDWRSLLSPAEFRILRDRKTEVPKSHPNWEETRSGIYHCRGCDLHVYRSDWKVVLDKGWAFFAHGEPNAILLDIDYHPNYAETPRHFLTTIEAKCRRCNSHLGHVVFVENRLLHCINGAAMEFRQAKA